MRHPVRAVSFLVIALGAAAAVAGCADDVLVSVPDPPPDPAPDPEPDPPAAPEPPPPTTSGDDCSTDDDCGAGAECEAGTCVGIGVLQVTLTFEVDADYDLHVLTPQGEEIYYGNPEAGGGLLDVDQCIFSCGPGTHVENIFFNGSLESGTYTAWAVNYDGRAGGPFEINVSGAATATLQGALLDAESDESGDLFFTVP